jgi:hypothetical protein
MANTVANFNGAAGSNSSASGDLPVNGEVAFNDNTELSGTIQFNDKGCVHGIRLERSASSPYGYTVYVDAEGPHGAFSGSGYLIFTDATGDAYHLSITRSKRLTHTVSYNSDKPNIVRIAWHN